MSLMLWAVIVIPATCYVLLMLYYFRHWNRLPEIVQDIDFQPKTAFSVVIAARNEQQNIRHCLSALTACRYPAHLLEIIVVDDHSTDETAAVVQDFIAKNATGISIRLLHPESGSGKKNAVATGIRHAAHPFIACTDADCEPPENWLLLPAQVFEKQSPKMIAGPVVFHREKKLVEWFQSLDLLGMMGVTGAGIQSRSQHLANGANIAYPKAVFEAVGGFEGNEHIASGDDMFLAQKIVRRWPGSIVFLKNPAAAMPTSAMPDWRSFIRQRLRWGTKNAALPEWSVKLSLAMVFLHCWLIIGLGISSLWSVLFLPYFSLALLAKLIPDYFFLRAMSHFFQKQEAMRWFFPGLILHILYIAGIGLASLVVKRYAWRGRVVR